MQFPEYLGLCGILHQRNPRFYPAVKFSGPEETSKKKNAEILFEKIRRQLQNFPRNKLDSLLQTLEINIRFGRFYLNDPRCKLQEVARSDPVHRVKLSAPWDMCY
jgi:hypothetical protein